MKATIPKTSQTQYITGSAALNIPDETGDAADWHFCEHFLNKNNLLSIPVAGVNFMSTTHILGDYGVHECSESLKRQGVHNINGTVYAANAVRAVLDLALRHICERGSSPEHIDANEYLATPNNLMPLTVQQSVLVEHLNTSKQASFGTGCGPYPRPWISQIQKPKRNSKPARKTCSNDTFLALSQIRPLRY